MIELNEKASNYAEENVINVLKEAIAKVYADGYRDGYKDCQDHVSAELSVSNIEYVDLGLPSGTLWASDYEKDDNEILYLPYELAQSYHIPSKEQWTELLENCKWEYSIKNGILIEARCVGNNGKILKFKKTGMHIVEELARNSRNKAIFWISNDKKSDDFEAVHIYYHYIPYNAKKVRAIESVFSGYRLPVRQVSTR